jgi:drug/metabolite transporter (DMT)-like permease
MWLAIALGGYLILAAVNITDKFILEKKIKNPAVFVFYSSAILLPIFLLIPFGVVFLNSLLDWTIAILSGLMFFLALWAMFICFQKSEVSHAGPLVGAVTPVFVLMLSVYFLGDSFDLKTLLAIACLVGGLLLIAREKSKKHDGWHMGIAWGVLAGFLFAVSHVSAKYIYDDYGFFSGLVWTRGAIALFGLLLLFSFSIRRELLSFAKNIHGFFKQAKSASAEKSGQSIIILNRIGALVGVFLIQWAIALGDVTIVNAIAGFQYAVLILAVFFLTKFVPKFFREEITSREIVFQLIAVLIIAVGLALLV